MARGKRTSDTVEGTDDVEGVSAAAASGELPRKSSTTDTHTRKRAKPRDGEPSGAAEGAPSRSMKSKRASGDADGGEGAGLSESQLAALLDLAHTHTGTHTHTNETARSAVRIRDGPRTVHLPVSGQGLREDTLGATLTRGGPSGVSVEALIAAMGEAHRDGAQHDTDGRVHASQSALALALAAGERSAPLRAPAPAAIVSRASRSAAYNTSSRTISRWNHLVQANRRAERIAFDAEAHADDAKVLPTTAALAATFTPADEFEAAVAAAVAATSKGKASSEGAPTERSQAGLEVVDDLPAASASEKEVVQRNKALARMRALLFYDEQKRRRQNAIKSKTYRRLKARADMKRGAKEREELEAADPAQAAALAEEEARLLAKERMSLKHRAGKGIGGSKWIQRVIARGGGGGGRDEGTKAAVQEHLRRAQLLRDRMQARRGDDDDSEDDDGDAGETIDDAAMLERARAQILESVGLTADGTELANADEEEDDSPSGLMAMKFMRNAADQAKQRAREEAQAVAKELEDDARRLRVSRIARIDKRRALAETEDSDDAGSGADERIDDEAPAEDDDDVADAGQFARPQAGGEAQAASRKRRRELASTAHALDTQDGGRRKFAGAVDASHAPRPRAMASSNPVSFNDAHKAAVSVTVDSVIPISAPVSATSNPWLTQGGARLNSGAPAASASSADADAPRNVNPWLANAFGSSAAADGGTGISRHKATQRARDAAQATTTGVINVAAGLQQLQRQSVAASTDAKSSKQPSRSKPAAAVESAGAADDDIMDDDDDDADDDAADSSDDNDEEEDVAAVLADQPELLRRAFAGHGMDAEEELAAEKDAEASALADDQAAAARKPYGHREMEQVPGWGSWAGLGAPAPGDAGTSTGKRRRDEKAGGRAKTVVTQTPLAAMKRSALAAAIAPRGVKAPPKPAKRKDAGNKRVMVSERPDRKVAQHQVPQLPHPFKSIEDYERHLRMPVGPEWHTATAVSELHMPEWTNKAGTIIDPIKYVQTRRKDDDDDRHTGRKHAASGGVSNRTKRRADA